MEPLVPKQINIEDKLLEDTEDKFTPGVFATISEKSIAYPTTTSDNSVFTNALLQHNFAAQSLVRVGGWASRELYTYFSDPEEWTQDPFDINQLKGTIYEDYTDDFAGMNVGEAALYKEQLNSLIARNREWSRTGFISSFVAGAAAVAVDPALYLGIGVASKLGAMAGSLVSSPLVQSTSRKLVGSATQGLLTGISKSPFTKALMQDRVRRAAFNTAIGVTHLTATGINSRALFASQRAESLAAEIMIGAGLGVALEFASPLFLKTWRSLFPKKEAVHTVKSELEYQRLAGNKIWKSAASPPRPPESTPITSEVRWQQAFGKDVQQPQTTAELEELLNNISQDLATNPNNPVKIQQAEVVRENLIEKGGDYESFKLFRRPGDVMEPDYWNVGPATFNTMSGKFYSGWKKLLNWSNLGGPAITLMEAKAPPARALLMKLTDSVFQLEGELAGVARPMNVKTMRETRLRSFYQSYGQAMDKEYAAYLKENPFLSKNYLDIDQWNKLIGRLASGEIDNSANKHVRSGVQKFRSFMSMITDLLKSRKLLGETVGDLPNAKYYFPQVYDVQRLRSDADFRARLISVIENDFRERWPLKQAEELQQKYSGKKLEQKLKGLDEYIKGAKYTEKTRVEAIEAVENITGMALGHSDVRYGTVSQQRGWSKARKIHVPQSLLAEFSDTHAHRVMQFFARGAFADISMVDAFGSYEFSRSKLAIELEEVYSKMIAHAGPNQSLALTNEREKVFKAAKVLWSDARQVFGTQATSSIDRAINAGVSRISSYASTAFLGRVSLSMIPEFFVKTLHVGVTPYLKGILNFVGEKAYGSHNINELKRFGIALSQTMHGSSSYSFLEHAPTTSKWNKFDAALKAGGKINAKMALYESSDSLIRTLSAFATVGELKTWVPKIAQGTATDHIKAQYAALGIDKNIAQKIVKMLDTHGQGTQLNLSEWTDDVARLRFLGSIQSSINNALITGDISTTPTVLTHGVQRLLFLFSQWVFAANHKIVGAGLQQGIAKSFIPLMLLIGSGIASMKIKEMVRGSSPEQSSTFGQLVAGGILYSGATGILGYMFEKVANIMGGEIGETLTGRYIPESAENTLLQLFGPAASFLDSGAAWSKAFLKYSGFTDEELSTKDFRRMYRAMPFQYHPFIYNFFSGRWPGIGAGDERVNRARMKRQMKYKMKKIIPNVQRALYEDLQMANLI